MTSKLQKKSKHSCQFQIGTMVNFLDWESALDYHNKVANGRKTDSPMGRLGILIDKTGRSECHILCDGEVIKSPNYLVKPVTLL